MASLVLSARSKSAKVQTSMSKSVQTSSHGEPRQISSRQTPCPRTSLSDMTRIIVRPLDGGLIATAQASPEVSCGLLQASVGRAADYPCESVQRSFRNRRSPPPRSRNVIDCSLHLAGGEVQRHSDLVTRVSVAKVFKDGIDGDPCALNFRSIAAIDNPRFRHGLVLSRRNSDSRYDAAKDPASIQFYIPPWEGSMPRGSAIGSASRWPRD